MLQQPYRSLSSAFVFGLVLITPLAQAGAATLELAVNDMLARTAAPAYRISADGHGANPDHGFSLAFTQQGVQIQGAEGGFTLHLERFGRGEGDPVAAVTPAIEGGRVAYTRSPHLTEWFLNLPRGLEQGWTVTERPTGYGPLVLALNAGRAPDQAGPEGPAWSGLAYRGLIAFDAAGRALPASLSHQGVHLRIEVDDADAVYPIVIDPWVQQKQFFASDGELYDMFGTSIAVDGDTAVIGAPKNPTFSPDSPGAAWVFVRSGGTWIQAARLEADDGTPRNGFGTEVAIVGDMILIGAPEAPIGGNNMQGAIYSFVRSEGQWTQQAKLVASDGVMGQRFGMRIAMQGNTAAAGVRQASIDGNNSQGAIYILEHSEGVWTEQQKLVASDGAASDQLGLGLAFDGDTIVAGAIRANSNSGAAYVFVRDGETWIEQGKLTPSDDLMNNLNFGVDVAVDGDTVLVGAINAAINGAAQHGSAYVFTRTDGVWSEQAKLVPSDGFAQDQFGGRVAVRGDLALIAAVSGLLTPGQPRPGTAWFFTRNGGVWSQQQKVFIPDSSPRAQFGVSLALLEDETALIGANSQDVGDTVHQGVVYVFEDMDAGQLRIMPDHLDFGEVIVLTDSGMLGVEVENIGTLDATVNEVTAPPSPFFAADGSCGETPFTLAPGASCTLNYAFSPEAAGAFQATLMINSDTPFSPNSLNLAGEGILARPQIQVDPEAVSMMMPTGDSTTETLTLGNLGIDNLVWQVIEDFQSPPSGEMAIVTHSASMVIEKWEGISCSYGVNHFLRTFTLPDFGILADFDVTEVTFGVDYMEVLDRSELTITVNLYSVHGDLVFDHFEFLGAEDVTLTSPQSGVLVTVPFRASVPAGATLVVEIETPELDDDFVFYYPGANFDGETAPSYLSAVACGLSEPTTYREAVGYDSHLAITVTGEVIAPVECSPPDWLHIDPATGTVMPEESQAVTFTADAAGLAAGEFSANTCIGGNDPYKPITIVPTTLTVTEGSEPVDDIFHDRFE